MSVAKKSKDHRMKRLWIWVCCIAFLQSCLGGCSNSSTNPEGAGTGSTTLKAKRVVKAPEGGGD
jgi:hypothetical protein